MLLASSCLYLRKQSEFLLKMMPISSLFLMNAYLTLGDNLVSSFKRLIGYRFSPNKIQIFYTSKQYYSSRIIHHPPKLLFFYHACPYSNTLVIIHCCCHSIVCFCSRCWQQQQQQHRRSSCFSSSSEIGGKEDSRRRRFSYDPVTIVNYTPIETLEIHVAYSVCHDDYSYEPLAPGDRWHGPNRGLCLINRVDISLNRSNPPYTYLACTPYKSTGTRYSFFNLEMRPDGDTCCVRSSHEEEYGGCHDTADDGKPLIWSAPVLYFSQ